MKKVRMNKKTKKFAAIIMCCSINYLGFGQTYPGNDPHWISSWDDNFTTGFTKTTYNIGSSSNPTGWGIADNFDHGGEIEGYYSGNVSISSTNGVVMTEYGTSSGGVTCTGCSYSPHYYTSGSFSSGNNRSVLYGYVEATIQSPNNYGLWPAFWLWSCTPTYNEIDVFEDVPGLKQTGSNDPLYNTYQNGTSMTSNYHFSTTHAMNCSADYNDEQIDPLPSSKDYSTAFHKYGVEWSPSKIVFYIDGQVYRNKVNPGFSDATPTTPGWINEQMGIIFDLAVSGYVHYGDNSGLGIISSPATVSYSYLQNYYTVPSWYTSINPNSINSSTGASMYVKEVKYYTLHEPTCNTNTFNVTSSFNWSNPSSSGYNYSSLNKNVIINSGSGNPTPSSSSNILRATNSISVPSGSSLSVPAGANLYLDVNPCY